MPPRTPLTARADNARPYALALFRIVVGVLFASHGAASIFGVLGGAAQSGGTIPTGTWPGWYSAVIELVGGSLVALGLGTRATALVASGAMAYAYFTVHQAEALTPYQNGGEAAAMFSWAFLLLVFTGPGAWALDRLLGTERTAAAPGTDRPASEREPSAA